MILHEYYLQIHFSETNDICYFLVSGVIRLTENFCSSFELAKQQVIISKVDMFEFDTIMSFIVLLIPLLPTPIFFIPFFLYTFLVKTCKKTEKNVGELNKLELCFGTRFNPKYGHRDKGQWLNPGSTLGPPRVTPDPPRSKRVQKGSPHHSSLKGFKRFQGKI